MTKFLIQLSEDTLLPSSDNCKIIELIQFRNWFRGNSIEIYYGFIGRDHVYKSVKDAACDYRIPLDNTNYSEYIPVGSIEFVNYILSITGNKPIKAINIPDELLKDKFTHRKCMKLSDENLRDLINSGDLDSWIIKPGSNPKKFDTITIGSFKQYKTEEFIDSSYFISEPIEIKNEWRVFIHNNRIIDYKKYSSCGQSYLDLEFVHSCITEYKNSPKSYTLDICETVNGEFAILEVHNFISCGLYGFEDDKIIDMLKCAWNYEIRK